jgi:hypothetical protein
MAATLICGASVFTACTNDSGDNPSPEPPKKDRADFIQHTRQNLKYLAENLNFETWNVANSINTNFNTYVLTNPDFEKVISSAFIAQAQSSIKPVDEGSELAEMGYKMYGVVDLTDFNYRFTINDEGTSFDIEPAEDFEMIVNAYNPNTQQIVPKGMKLKLKAGGSSFTLIMKPFSTEDFAFLAKIPTEFSFNILCDTKNSGEWSEMFNGSFKNEVSQGTSSEFINRMTDAFNVSGIVNSSLPAYPARSLKGDATTMTFAINQDPATHEAGLNFGIIQNERKMIELSGVMKNMNGLLDFTKFTSSSNIMDMIMTIIAGNSLEEATVTLLDDLTTTVKMDDSAQAFGLLFAMSSARRNYANYETIDGYVQQLNSLVSASMSCKGLNQQIPMRIQTTKIGVDYWAVPALNFADENGYVALTDMLDKESIEYMVNIADHAAVPMYQSIIVVTQLVRYMKSLTNTVKEQQQKMQP